MNNMVKQIIPIFFTIDSKYVPYIDVAIRSLMENASNDYNYEIKVLYQDLDEGEQKKLKSLSDKKENFDIDLIYMKEGLEAITDREENKLRCDYFTLSIFFRLFIPEMFPEYDKGIYIDSDIVVPGDISELYNIELKDNIIGASPDYSIQEVPELMYYVTNAIGVKAKEYINSGVLLMNLKMMREKKFTTHFLNLLNTYHFDTIAPDQDYINAMCNGKIFYLNECWDAMPNNNKAPLTTPKLIHYNLFQKPWCYDNIQYEDYFWRYAKQSTFYEKILTDKNNYSEKNKSLDSETLKTLVDKGNKMPEKEITFKKVFENGEKIRI